MNERTADSSPTGAAVPGAAASAARATGLASHLTSAFAGAALDNLFRGLVGAVLMVVASQHAVQSGGNATVVQMGYALLAGIAFMVPFVIFAPLAGTIGDRWPKHLVMRWVRVLDVPVCLLGVAGIGLRSSAPDLSFSLLLSAMMLLGVASAFFATVKLAALPELAPHRLVAANAWMQGVSIVAIMVGQAMVALGDLATPAQLGLPSATPWMLVLGAALTLSLGGVIAAFLIPRLEAKDPGAPLRPFAFRATVDAAWSVRGLILPAASLAGFWALGAAATALIPAMVAQSFLPETAPGTAVAGRELAQTVLSLAIALGIIAGAGSAPLLMARAFPAGLPVIGALIAGAGIFLAGSSAEIAQQLKHSGQSVEFWTCAGFLFLAGIGAGLWEIPLQVLIQERSPAQSRNRVMAAVGVLSAAAMVLVMAACWGVVRVVHLDAAAVLSLLGGTTCVAAIAALWPFRRQVTGWLLALASRTIWHLHIVGAERIPRSGGCLVVCNHLSYVDGLILGVCLPRPGRFLVYRRYVDMPVVGWFLRFAGVIPVAAEDRRSALLASIDAAVEAAKRGEMVVIFPEGKLTRTGQMDSFRRGLERIAQRADVPVVPAHLHGLAGTWMGKMSRRRCAGWPMGGWWPSLRRRVSIHVGETLPATTNAGAARHAVSFLAYEHALSIAHADRSTLAHAALHRARRHPFAIAVQDAQGELTGWKLTAIARALIPHLNLKDDERAVGILLPPGRAGSIANLALALAGRTAVNLNHTAGAAQVRRMCEIAGVRSVISAGLYLRRIGLSDLQGALNVRAIAVEDLLPKLGTLAVLWQAFGNALLPARWRCSARPDDVAAIVFSSGSTGDPKGIELTHRQILANCRSGAEALNLRPGHDGVLNPLPLFHSFGLVPGMWMGLCLGVRVIGQADPTDGEAIGKLAQATKATWLISTPTFVRSYLRRIEPGQLSTLIGCIVGAERCPAELKAQFKARFGSDLLEGYGCTELAPVVAVNLPDVAHDGELEVRNRDGSVGRPMPGIHVLAVDPATKAILPPGGEGLLVVLSPARMRGYLGRPDLTDAAFVHGGYNTGDIGTVDEQGFVRITGRLARFAKIAGEMVPLDNVEAALSAAVAARCPAPADQAAQHDTAIEVAVAAVADPARGERLIVLHTGFTGDWAACLAELESLPALWRPKPRDIYAVASLPRLGTGKRDLGGVKKLAASVVNPGETKTAAPAAT